MKICIIFHPGLELSLLGTDPADIGVVFHTSIFIVLVEDWAEGSSTGHWVNYCTFIH